MSLFTATLAADSPLRDIFPVGSIPVAKPFEQHALLGGAKTAEGCYLLALRSVTYAQRVAMAEMMHQLGQGSRDEALAALAALCHDEFLPVRSHHVSSVSIPMRFLV